jgi:hypothetical protein
VYSNGALIPKQGDITKQAMDLTTQRAISGAPGIVAGNQFITQGLNGSATPAYNATASNYSPAYNATPAYSAQSNLFGSGSNPYLDATFQKAALGTQNQLASEFGRSGRNIDQSQGIRAQQLNDLATNIYGGDYSAERNRMAQEQSQNQQLNYGAATGAQSLNASAAGAAQGLNYGAAMGAQGINANAADAAAQRQQGLLGYGLPYGNQSYTDLQQLASVGGAQDAYGNAVAAAPGNQVDDYIRRLSTLTGNGGGSSSVTGPAQSRNVLGGAAGGALAGSQILPGWGTAIGGLLGGIFG